MSEHGADRPTGYRFPLTLALTLLLGAAPQASLGKQAGYPKSGENGKVTTTAIRGSEGAVDQARRDTVTAADYRIYTGEGQPLEWDAVVDLMRVADVVFVGETHNDPIAHHIEAMVMHEAIALGDRPAAGSMEMFHRDMQGVVDEYLAGLITERHFKAESRPWQNYDQDYRPFVEAAKEAGAPIIAANAPRRYVNRVSRLGRSSLNELPASARQWMAPIPYAQASDAYKAEWDALMAEAMGGMPVSDSSANHGMGNALDSQSLWDATMAFSIADHLMRNPGDRVVHIVGSFHVKNGTGTPEHLELYRPGTKSLIIVVEPAEDPTAFAEDHHGLGDIVILADEAVPRSY